MTADAWEVAPGLYCLGPNGRTQTNVYFVRSDAGWVLIDAGWERDGPRIELAAATLAAAEIMGDGSRPRAILLTHCHPDHSGAALDLARAWDCPVWMHPAELPIAMGDFEAMRTVAGPLDRWVILPVMQLMGRRRREALLARSRLGDVAREFEPGGEVPGLPGWQCIPTPGHTPGHVAYFRVADRALISGDALVTLRVNSPAGLVGRQGFSGPPWYTTWGLPAARASVRRLAELEPTVVAGGHGWPRKDAQVAVELRAFADRIDATGWRP